MFHKNKLLQKEEANSNYSDGIKYFVKSAGDIIDVYLNGQIESSRENSNIFDVLRSAGIDDVINIYINSSGGDLMTAIQFISILKKTEAKVFCSVEGECMSAATMILMYAKEFAVDNNSIFMIHTYSGDIIGKGHELHSQVLYERNWSVKLIKEVYNGFLNDVEMQKVIDGADIWLDRNEVVKRLKLRKKYLEKKKKSEVFNSQS
jgi:ATP-dependent protease ClpP protease subunit